MGLFLVVVLLIDWLTIKVPCLHAPIRSGSLIKVLPSGEIDWEKISRLSVKGTFESSLSIKSQLLDEFGNATVIHFSGNFCKFIQGHNAFGTSDISSLIYTTLIKFAYIFEYKFDFDILSFIDWQRVKGGDIEIDRIDINEMFELRNRHEVNQWLRAAEYTSSTRHGRPRNEKGSIYWGKDSRRWSLKAYCKAAEVEDNKCIFFSAPQNFKYKDFIQNLLRLELTLRQLELRRLNIKYVKDLNEIVIKDLYREYVNRLNMAEKMTLTDHETFNLPPRLAGTYQLWKSGYPVFQLLPRSTFFLYKKLLLEHKIDISNPPPSQNLENVVPLIRFLEAKPVDCPEWFPQAQLLTVS